MGPSEDPALAPQPWTQLEGLEISTGPYCFVKDDIFCEQVILLPQYHTASLGFKLAVAKPLCPLPTPHGSCRKQRVSVNECGDLF